MVLSETLDKIMEYMKNPSSRSAFLENSVCVEEFDLELI